MDADRRGRRDNSSSSLSGSCTTVVQWETSGVSSTVSPLRSLTRIDRRRGDGSKPNEEASKMKRVLVSVLMMTLTMAAVMMYTMRSVKAETIVFTAQMLAANEVQAGTAVNPTEAGTTGQAIVTLDTTVV